MSKTPYRLFLDPTEVSANDYNRRSTKEEDKFKFNGYEFFLHNSRLFCTDEDDMQYEFCPASKVCETLIQFQKDGIKIPESMKRFYRI